MRISRIVDNRLESSSRSKTSARLWSPMKKGESSQNHLTRKRRIGADDDTRRADDNDRRLRVEKRTDQHNVDLSAVGGSVCQRCQRVSGSVGMIRYSIEDKGWTSHTRVKSRRHPAWIRFGLLSPSNAVSDGCTPFGRTVSGHRRIVGRFRIVVDPSSPWDAGTYRP